MAHADRSAVFRHAAQVAATTVAVIATVVLLGGWLAGVDALKSMVGGVSMKANTAAGLVLCGWALFLLADPRGVAPRAARALAAAAGTIGLLTVVEYAARRGLGIDELVFRDATNASTGAPPGRMAPQTAVGLVLVSIALLGLDRRLRRWWPAGTLAVIVTAIAATALLGHIYGVPSLFALSPFTAMAPHTAAALVLLGIGITCARPDRGIVGALTADTTAGMLLRFLVPPALVVPLIVGTLVIVGERHGLYGDGEAIYLLIVATVFGCVTFAIAAAGTTQSLDAKRRKADQLLLDHTRRYRNLVERLPLITYTDTLGPLSAPIYVSPQVQTTLGYTPDEWIADPTLAERLVHPDDRERVLPGIARFRDTGEPFRCEYRLRASSGHYVWVHDERVQVMDQTRGFLYAQGYMLDITDRKAAEQEAHALQEQLGEAQRLETVGQLAGGVAHDFSNMLGAVIAYAGFAEEKAQGQAELLEDVAQIRRAAERGAALTQELLVFGRKDVVRKRVMDLNEAVTDTMALVRPLFGDRHELRRSLTPGIPCVDADPAQIERILMNLVLNARAAMPAGGSVEVSSARVTVDAADAPMGLAPGDFVGLSVSDSGAGMSPEIARRAFEPFFTTKPKGEGTGLGLAIVYGIAKRLGGHVTIDSKPGCGTNVTLLFPAVYSEPADTPPKLPPSRAEGHGETVLVVDDDEALRRSTARILSANGYAVLEASDGVDGLAEYRAAHPSPSVVVTDVVMPGMTGPELAAAITAVDSRSHVVFMSGYPEGLEDVRDDAPLVAKPFTPDVLLTAVSEALAATEPSVR